jgi:HSP20 family protein
MFEQFWATESPLAGHMRRLEQELDELLHGGATLTGTRDIRSPDTGSFPPLNVAATPEAVTVYLFAPGVNPKNLDLSIQNNLLSVSGQREIPVDERAMYYRRERFSGEFRRAISLPEDADPERIQAKYMNGIVTVTIGRRASSKPRQIEVR